MKIIFYINEFIIEITYFSLYSNESINYEDGNIYRKGKILQQDINKAAKQNVLEAQFNLGNIYSTGKYVQIDTNKATKYLFSCC